MIQNIKQDYNFSRMRHSERQIQCLLKTLDWIRVCKFQRTRNLDKNRGSLRDVVDLG
jgi:hypothetical protein